MTSGQQGKIISLTYHEITQDARVLKQARSLRNAGYEVNVFCDWPEGMPQHDDIDGVRITRFKCFGPQGVRHKILDELPYLEKSRGEIADRFVPFASACEVIEETRSILESKFGPNAFERLQSKYFKTAEGRERRRRLVEYLILNFRFRYLGAISFSKSPEMSKRYQINRGYNALRTFRTHRHKLFQLLSLVYCSNFPELRPTEKVAAVHAHDIYCLPAGVMLSQKLNVPLVYDAHEYEPSRATKMDSEAMALPEWIEDDCFPFVSRIITVSDGLGKLYAQRFRGPEPLIVMNSPEIDSASLIRKPVGSDGLRTVREQAGLSEDVPLIVFTGGIQREHRGVDKVLEALVDLPDTHLVSLGSRNRENDQWFQRLAADLGVETRVHLLQPVDARDVTAAIESATVSVAPIQDVSLSYRFCMPNKLFEAAFARIPICVSDLPDMRRFVETLGIGRVMDQTDPKAIAAALREVFENPEAYRMTPEAERKLVEIYSWKAQAEKLLALYDDLVGPPPAKS